MGLQKYRADSCETQSDGAKLWTADWMGGKTLAKIENCKAENLHDMPRLTVYIQGESDTFFSIPAKARYFGKVINGYVTTDESDDRNLVFRHCYY